MYLKAIKAHGFKSFADKINIELNEGITGVVGPNGSGKSNVVDAVRWVLGEQSVKSLRGDGNMTDVIFSGSKSRNALNVASVTLIFDNTDKYLPIDFTEISIKRRVYKDGTNEYYLNNEKCRLKDITDLLLDTGIAKESFNIISQGKIEEIISSKPNDRRVIFEEAAGVLKYKKRKEEALRKLDRTHENMSRVDDIIDELEVQVEPLKIQKETAEKYEEYNKELKTIEISLITSDITELNTKYQENKIKIEELSNELVNMNTTNSSNEASISKMKLDLNNIDEEIKNKQKQLLDLTTNVEKINSQKQIILERKKYEVDDSKLHQNIVFLKEQELKFELDVNQIESDLSVNRQELENLTNKVNEQQLKINKEKDNRKSLENNLSNKVRTSQNIELTIDRLKNSIENNGSLPYSVKAVLDNPKLKGIHSVIGNSIEVEEQYSCAIATSLGMNANFIITKTEKDAKDAIYYLKQQNIGRATFFPIDIIKAKQLDLSTMNILNNIDGFIGIASNLVKYEEIYNGIITNQLGNVIIASNLETATLISKQISHRYKVVTLGGDVLHVGGSLTGGNQQKTRSIISEKYELEEKIHLLNNTNNEIKKLEEKLNESDYNLRSLEDQLYIYKREEVELQQLIISNNKISNEKKTELELCRKELVGTNNMLSNSLSAEEENVLKEYYDALKEKENFIFNLDLVTKKRTDLQERIEDMEFSVKKENSLFQTKNKELKQLEIDVNRADVKLDNLLNSLGENYSITYEKAKETYRLEMDETIARGKVSNLKRLIADLGPINIAAKEEYERVSTRYEFLISQKQDLLNAEDTLLKIIKEMDSVMEKEFIETFKTIKEHFTTTFKELFRGGNAELKLTDPENILETGVEIVACPPGKKLASISLLSGGEKTFTAISLLFAILKSRPIPFCILDEVEAALDEVNVDSFGKYLKNLQSKTQFILITHKKKTMEYANVLYGITMQESGVSKLVSVKLEDIEVK